MIVLLLRPGTPTLSTSALPSGHAAVCPSVETSTGPPTCPCVGFEPTTALAWLSAHGPCLCGYFLRRVLSASQPTRASWWTWRELNPRPSVVQSSGQPATPNRQGYLTAHFVVATTNRFAQKRKNPTQWSGFSALWSHSPSQPQINLELFRSRCQQPIEPLRFVNQRFDARVSSPPLELALPVRCD